jgi:hypothetical protein
VAATEMNAVWHTTSNQAESGLLQPDHLQAIWPSLKNDGAEQRQTTTVDNLVTKHLSTWAESPTGNWLLVDCLPALSVLQGALATLKNCSVVWTRVVIDPAVPDLEKAQLSSVQSLLEAYQFKQLVVMEGLHPALGEAIFVRNWPTLMQDELMQLEDQQALDQTELRNLNQVLRTSLQEQDMMHQQVLVARDAEVMAKAGAIAQCDALANEKNQLVATLDVLLKEKADLAAARDAEATAKAGAFAQRDVLTNEKNQLLVTRDVLLKEKADLSAVRDAEATAKAEVIAQRDALANEKNQLLAGRDTLAKEKADLATVRDVEAMAKAGAIAQRDALASERNQLLATRDDLLKEKADLAAARDAEATAKAEAIAQRDALANEKNQLLAGRDTLAKEKADLATARDVEATAKAGAIAQRDALASEKNQLLAFRDTLSKEKADLAAARDAEATAKAVAIAQCDALTNEKNQLVATRDVLLKEKDALTAARDEQTKLATESQHALIVQQQEATSLQHRIQQLEADNYENTIRQQLQQEELVKAEAQIELIKDLLLREPGL